VSGVLSASSAAITGGLSAGSGTFSNATVSGGLSAASAAITGGLSAESATFSNATVAGSLSVGGQPVFDATGTLNQAQNDKYAQLRVLTNSTGDDHHMYLNYPDRDDSTTYIFNDPIISGNATVSGVLSASSAAITGGVSAGSGTFSAPVVAPNQIQAPLVGTVRVRGSGLNWTGDLSRNIVVNGTDQAGESRGLHVTVIRRSDHTVLSNHTYDTYDNPVAGQPAASDAMAALLNGLDDTVLVAIASFDAWTTQLTPAGRTALARVGGSQLVLTIPNTCCDDLTGGRTAYALLGIPGTGLGAGIERWVPSGEGVAEFAALLVGPDVVGMGGPQPSVGFWYTYGGAVIATTSSWVDVPATTVSFSLQRRSTVKMEYALSMDASTAGNHCGIRFVVDGVPQGHSQYGNTITMGTGSDWWQTVADMIIEPLAPGQHTVYIQIISVNNGSCGLDTSDYSRPWVAVTAFPY
jgi:hypothetical protein